MLTRMLTAGLLAGCAAGLVAALLQLALMQDLILTAEQYETGAAVHFSGAGSGGEGGHSHAAGAEPHGHGAPAAPLTRSLLTVVFAVLTYGALGLVLVSGFAVAERLGQRITPQAALVWGLAGFAAVILAPAMGLAPELPGTPAADLRARQLWWAGTVLATGGGLSLIAFGRRPAFALAGLVLIVLPHLVGAPHLEGFHGLAPPELAGTFAARALGVGLVAWLVLGWAAGRLWSARGRAA